MIPRQTGAPGDPTARLAPKKEGGAQGVWVGCKMNIVPRSAVSLGHSRLSDRTPGATGSNDNPADVKARKWAGQGLCAPPAGTEARHPRAPQQRVPPAPVVPWASAMGASPTARR
jgi:hypothetical protein